MICFKRNAERIWCSFEMLLRMLWKIWSTQNVCPTQTCQRFFRYAQGCNCSKWCDSFLVSVMLRPCFGTRDSRHARMALWWQSSCWETLLFLREFNACRFLIRSKLLRSTLSDLSENSAVRLLLPQSRLKASKLIFLKFSPNIPLEATANWSTTFEGYQSECRICL